MNSINTSDQTTKISGASYPQVLTTTTVGLEAKEPSDYISTEFPETSARPAQTLAAPTQTTRAQEFIKTLAQVIATAPNDAKALTPEGQQKLENSFNILLINNKANILNVLGNNPLTNLKNQIQIPEALDKLINGILNNAELQQELQGTKAQEFKETIVNYLANLVTQNQINQAFTESPLSSNDTAKAWLNQFYTPINTKYEQPALVFSIVNNVSALKPVAKGFFEQLQKIVSETINSMPQQKPTERQPGVDALTAIHQRSEIDSQSANLVGAALHQQSERLGQLMKKTIIEHLPKLSSLMMTATNFAENLLKKGF